MTALTSCQCSQLLCGHTVFSIIFAKTATFAKPFFSCLYGAQVVFFYLKNLSKISWHCPFKPFSLKSLNVNRYQVRLDNKTLIHSCNRKKSSQTDRYLSKWSTLNNLWFDFFFTKSFFKAFSQIPGLTNQNFIKDG